MKTRITIAIAVAFVIAVCGISKETDLYSCSICHTGKRMVVRRFWGIIITKDTRVQSAESGCNHEWKRIGGNTQYGPFGLVTKAEP